MMGDDGGWGTVVFRDVADNRQSQTHSISEKD